MPKNGFNVAVVDKNGFARSDIWKVRISRNSDVMIGNICMGQFKYNIHAPRGDQFGCHLAWNSEEKTPERFRRGRRSIHRWERRRTEIGKAIAVFSLNFPARFLADPYKSRSLIDVTLPVPLQGQSAELIFLFSRQPLKLSGWPAETSLVFSRELPSSEFIHCVHWQMSIPDEFILNSIESAYPERNSSALSSSIDARFTIHLEPDENGCVKAIEVGGNLLREMLTARWVSGGNPTIQNQQKGAEPPGPALSTSNLSG